MRHKIISVRPVVSQCPYYPFLKSFFTFLASSYYPNQAISDSHNQLIHFSQCLTHLSFTMYYFATPQFRSLSLVPRLFRWSPTWPCCHCSFHTARCKTELHVITSCSSSYNANDYYFARQIQISHSSSPTHWNQHT